MSEGTAYRNKDIEFKVLSEAYKERSFEAYGLKLPRILPAVSANELRMEQVFVGRLPTEEIYQRVKYKLEHRER